MMMAEPVSRQWLDPVPVEPSSELTALVNGSRLAAELLVRRGISLPSQAIPFLSPEDYRPASPLEFPGMEKAVERILSAVKSNELICVWGDFDVDGQTSTTILVSALRRLKARVTHYIPVRGTESHGVHMAPLQLLAGEGVTLMVTCDTGISAVEETSWAMNNGMDVVITDHHELPASLPPAVAIVNPRLLPADHHLHPLPGCGVAWELASEMLSRSGESEYAATLLDLAALGIVADVAELRGEARYLLQRGLALLRQTGRVGLKQLYARAGVDPASLTEETIGFALTPRLNALGRLSDANPIVDFFTTDSNTEAVFFADQLEELNNRRRMACSQVYLGAMKQIDANPALLTAAALVLGSPDWPAGVNGIVASRLAESFQRPVILFTAPVDGIARGSARSVPGIQIIAAITSLSEMLNSFGGHPMAAGLSLPSDRIPDFRQALSYAITQQTAGMDLQFPLQLDANLPLSRVDHETVNGLELLAPFGNGNPAPVFLSPGHRVVEVVPIGAGQEHQLVKVEDENGQIFSITRWYGADLPLPEGIFDLAYTPRASTFQGKMKLQFTWVDSRPATNAKRSAPVRTRMQVEDQRGQNPAALLDAFGNDPDAVIWGEACRVEGIRMFNRVDLHPAATLVIAFTPPGADEIRTAMQRTKPRRVVLLQGSPAVDDLRTFLRTLMAKIKPVLGVPETSLSLEELSAACAQRRGVVQLALDYLASTGNLVYTRLEDGTMRFSTGSGSPAPNAAVSEKKLVAALQEVQAFRRNFSSAPLPDLIRDYFNH